MTQTISKIDNLTAEQAAWLAGLFQGEAHFYLDKRVRSTSGDPNYTPPPAIPSIKLEMVEEDLMMYVANLLGKNLKCLNRKTSAAKPVYRIVLTARNEVKAFLLKIQPYIIGKKTLSKIEELLDTCDEHDIWLAQGGRRKAAQVANKASQESRRTKLE